MAEGQAAQKNVRNLFFPGQTRPGGVPGGRGESGPRSLRYTPVLRELNFWKVSLAQYQWKTAPAFSQLISPRSQTTRPAPTERPHQRQPTDAKATAKWKGVP